MRKYIFGLKAEEYAGAETDFFHNSDNNPKAVGVRNPYDGAWLNKPENRGVINQIDAIKSIPSPYARMHVTDIAFKEANCGVGINNAVQQANMQLSPDYLKAMSHCLDMFELMYHSDEFDLAQKGITLHKLDLVSTENPTNEEYKVLYDHEDKLTSYGKYIKTLDLFRGAYMSKINQKKAIINASYSFDFKSLYVFKYKGKAFAATSPFTGFFTMADCDLTEADIVVRGRKLLSKDSQNWRNHRSRSREFIEFMYLLLKDYHLDVFYVNLFKTIDSYIREDNAWYNEVENKTFARVDDYAKFNMETAGLQSVPNTDIYLRPDGLDCSYLKFLLYLQKPVDLTIRDEEYKVPLKERTFAGNLLQWVGVNDILSDGLFVLPYDVNDNYTVVPYCDKTRGDVNLRRCLVPIKSEILEFFPVDTLVNNLTITRTQPEVFVAELKINLGGGNFTVLRREYHVDDKLAKFPNGKLIMGGEMTPFAFGVYPFVKTNVQTEANIYKVLFYNVFDGKYKLNFFHKDENGKVVPYLHTEHQANKTNDLKSAIKFNCEYHHLNNEFGLEYAELTVDGYTSLIVPRLRQIQKVQNKVNVSIDLGTSNTYIAYSVLNLMNPERAEICQIKTNHITADGVKWNELTFMNKSCEDMYRPEGVKECNDDDLVVKLSDDANQKASSLMLNHQLCEFIPSKIDPTGNGSYSFPIPSVMNFLRVNTEQVALENHVPNPLVNTAIPFAYYERGGRISTGASVYDQFSFGTDFKWFKTSDGKMYTTKREGESAFKAFIRELLFIVRSHLISEGYRLSKVDVYWSYPLSFDKVLLDDYKTEWNNAFKQVVDAESEGRVHYTCESRSPIYSCIDDLNIDDLTLLVDIGGGSTDVIGYQQMNPLFVSSTMFAGNALYLRGGLNRLSSVTDTLIYYFVKEKLVSKVNEAANEGVENKPVSINDDLTTIMNYGFARYKEEFEAIFRNPYAAFMLKLHNSALIYHIAQLCHAKSPNAVPKEIYLTGNGSNQLYMNDGYEKLVREIFANVYSNADLKEKCEGIEITFQANPKAATAEGTLKGLQYTGEKSIALDNAASGESYIAYGDGKNVLENTEYGAAVNGECKIENVIKNAKDFVEMFYEDIYKVPEGKASVKKNEMLVLLDDLKNSSRLNSNDEMIKDSYFLRLMSEVMENLSKKLYKDLTKTN